MYGIEQKIINWLKNQKTKPITSSDSNKIVKTTKNQLNSVESTDNNSTEKVDEQNKSAKQEMLNTIKKYSDMLKGYPEEILLDKITYTEKTQDEIKDLATDFAENNFNASKAKLDGNIEKKRQESLYNEEKIKSQDSTSKENIDKKYEDMLDNVQSKAIKNGIARSSILAESIKNLSQDKIEEYLNVDKAVASQLKENAVKLENYEIEYNSAIKELEFEKANDISKKIEELNKEQQKKIEEVTKYNNAIDEKIYNYKMQGLETPTEEETANYKKIMLNTALEYYYSLDPEVARKEFENDVDVQYALGGMAKVVQTYLNNR